MTLIDLVRTVRGVAVASVVSWCVLSCSLSALAQSAGTGKEKFYDVQITSILQQFKNYRYGTISIFELKGSDFSNLREFIDPEPKDTAKVKCDNEKQQVVRSFVNQRGMTPNKLQQIAANPTKESEEKLAEALETTECQNYAQFLFNRRNWENTVFKKAYIVTTRYRKGEDPTIIGLVTSRANEDNVTDNMTSVNKVFSVVGLDTKPVSKSAREKYDDRLALLLGTPKVSEFLQNYIRQNSESEGVNLTAEAQGLGEVQFLPETFGKSQRVKEDDIQQYIRISEGQPMNYYKPNELIVSPDLISWKYYESKTDASMASTGSLVDDSASMANAERTIYNKNLPKYGVELRYGIDPVNMPSFFSERVALNAVWGMQRLGLILPTNGWSALGESFGITRRLTHAGIGINGSLDVPIKITNSSTGVFNFSGSYVFNDAVQSGHQRTLGSFNTTDTTQRANQNTYTVTNLNQSRSEDNLIRFHAQAHYTFAIQVDNGHFFRFRIGGALFQREQWVQTKIVGSEDRFVNGNNVNQRSISDSSVWVVGDRRTYGDVSGRIEYMATTGSTPFGLGLQYFDSAIMGDAWLFIPFNEAFGVRLDARMAAPIFRDPYPFENISVFVPSARIIYNF